MVVSCTSAGMSTSTKKFDDLESHNILPNPAYMRTDLCYFRRMVSRHCVSLYTEREYK